MRGQVRFICMPTNVTPEYKEAEEAYRKAREPKERLDCLQVLRALVLGNRP